MRHSPHLSRTRAARLGARALAAPAVLAAGLALAGPASAATGGASGGDIPGLALVRVERRYADRRGDACVELRREIGRARSVRRHGLEMGQLLAFEE